MFKFLKNRGQKFTELYLSMRLADGQQSTPLVQKARVSITYFDNKLNCRIPFAKDIPLPTNDSPVRMNNSSIPTSSIFSDVPVQSNPADETETSDLHLHEEGQNFDAEVRNDLTVLLNENKDVFRLRRVLQLNL
ncbi:transposon Tf2-6 polyprotein [Nephila pilipes]|uniref:Transposon Tf2-6 polyprotein n=1 Tax=Nephila pilipes TaxID=299642 RepID=A0A8X6QC13_NEPPI|nr:transposon Tf2-6 polyprotein [Nephila pilipes]